MSETCPYPDHGTTPCGRCSGCCGAEEYCCAMPEVALEAWKRDAEKAEERVALLNGVIADRDDRIQREVDEVARLQSQLKEIGDTIRYHLPPEVPESSHMGALIEATARLSTERDLQTGRVMIENARLRAVLAIFADEENWAVGWGGAEWIDAAAKPWEIAQQALAGEKTDPSPAPD